MLRFSPHAFSESDTQKTLLAFRDHARDWSDVVAMLDERFALYRAALPVLDRIADSPQLASDNRDDLLGIYGSRSRQAVKIKNAVRRLSLIQCPYCGEPSTPTHIDHFLPQSIFPEFAFFSQNLIPACDHCNETKRADLWSQGSNSRNFLNPFLDPFLGTPFFHLTITPDSVHGYNVPLFAVEWDHAYVPDPTDRQRCASHFRELHIVDRICEHILHRCKRVRAERADRVVARQLSTSELTTDLMRLHQVEMNLGTPNSWDALTFRSICRDPAYVDFICTVPFQAAAQ